MVENCRDLSRNNMVNVQLAQQLDANDNIC